MSIQAQQAAAPEVRAPLNKSEFIYILYFCKHGKRDKQSIPTRLFLYMYGQVAHVKYEGLQSNEKG
jgi:predicted peptidase